MHPTFETHPLAGRIRPRNRGLYVVLVVAVIVAGLASRHYATALPPVLGKYPGDALWALMVFLALGCIAPRLATAAMACAALAICFAVEFSQLYHAPWIQTVRATTLGHLALGSGFHAQDLAAYLAGVAVGVIGEKCTQRK